MKITLNSYANSKIILNKFNQYTRQNNQTMSTPYNTHSNSIAINNPLFYPYQISFGQNHSPILDDNLLFNESDSSIFSIKFFNIINDFLMEYKNKSLNEDSLYILKQDKLENALSKRNVTIMNNASAGQVNAEIVDMFNFASANKIQSTLNTYLFDNSSAKDIKANNIYLSDNAFSSNNVAKVVWLKDNAIAEKIMSDSVYQRNFANANDVSTKNFYASDNIFCNNLETNNIMLKDSARIENATVVDGKIELNDKAKINNLNTQNSNIVLNKSTKITNITSEDNLTITGNGTIDNITVKGSHLFLNGPIKIKGKINFSEPNGIVIAQKGKQNIFPQIDSSMIENGILQFLITDNKNFYLGNPYKVFSSGCNLLDKNITEQENSQVPVYATDPIVISEINNNPSIKNLYTDFYKDNLELLANDNKNKSFSLFWVKNAKLGKIKLVDLWMEALLKQVNTLSDTQKVYKINNLTEDEKKLLLEKTTNYWFENILPQIKNEKNFHDLEDFKQNLNTIENLINDIRENSSNLSLDNEVIYEKLISLELDNQSLLDFWFKKEGLKDTSEIDTERLKKEHLKEIFENKTLLTKILQIIKSKIENEKKFIKSYEFACEDLIKNEPELNKFECKLLKKYQNSKLFYQIISKSTKTKNNRNIEIQILKILNLLTNERKQLFLDAEKNIFDKTLNISNVVTTKQNSELDSYVNFVFTTLSQNIKEMKKEELFDFISDINAFRNFVNKNSIYFDDYWIEMVKTAQNFYNTKMLDLITNNNLQLIYSIEQNKKETSKNDIEFFDNIQKNSTDTIEQKEFISRFKDNKNFEKLMKNNGIDKKKTIINLLMMEALNENLYENRLNSYAIDITPSSVKENLDLTDKYLVLLDKDYFDMSIEEKYKVLSKVPNEEFRLMNKIILNKWKINELKQFLNNKFVEMQLEYNINAQSKHIKDSLERVNQNLDNIRVNIAGQNYTLQEIASNLDILIDVSKKSFKELYFIGENIESINENTASIKANTRAVLYTTMQNSKMRDPALSKMIEELLPAVEKGSFCDFLTEIEKKYNSLKEEKKKKTLKQIVNLSILALAATGVGAIDPSLISQLLGGGTIIDFGLSSIKPIADTLKHVAIFKVATTGIK